MVDSSSIEVKRRQRRAKTDRMDVEKLLGLLLRYEAGERKAWSVVHVPTVVDEDARQLHRELLTTKRDRNRVTNRIRGLLASHGLEIDFTKDVARQLEAPRQWDGSSRLARKSSQGVAYIVSVIASASERMISAA